MSHRSSQPVTGSDLHSQSPALQSRAGASARPSLGQKRKPEPRGGSCPPHGTVSDSQKEHQHRGCQNCTGRQAQDQGLDEHPFSRIDLLIHVRKILEDRVCGVPTQAGSGAVPRRCGGWRRHHYRGHKRLKKLSSPPGLLSFLLSEIFSFSGDQVFSLRSVAARDQPEEYRQAGRRDLPAQSERAVVILIYHRMLTRIQLHSSHTVAHQTYGCRRSIHINTPVQSARSVLPFSSHFTTTGIMPACAQEAGLVP